jgi:hypothetical protein
MELFFITWWTNKDDKVDVTTSRKKNCNNNNWWMIGHDGWTTKMTRCIMRWMTKGNYVNDKNIKWKNMQQVLMFQSFLQSSHLHFKFPSHSFILSFHIFSNIPTFTSCSNIILDIWVHLNHNLNKKGKFKF